METATVETAKNGSGKHLSRDTIVLAALKFIDRKGAQGLTMRALANEFDVVPMALYRYVHGREDLLEAVVAVLLERVRADLDGELAKSCWQGYLQTLATSVRRIAMEHPSAFPLVATRHPSAPWLRPPLRSLEIVEDFLRTLRGHGFSDEHIVATYRAFSSFLLGTLLLESASRGAKTSPVEVAFDEGDAHIPNEDGQVDLKDKPETARLRPLLSEDHSDEEFEIALETLLDRLELDLSQ
jgi:TetR/AcrR family tetracycline transcriptional repressor